MRARHMRLIGQRTDRNITWKVGIRGNLPRVIGLSVYKTSSLQFLYLCSLFSPYRRLRSCFYSRQFIKKEMAQVIVVGGGLAGLSAAHTLLERGASVLLLDKQGFV